VRSDPADPARARRAVACLALTALLGLGACSGNTSIPPPPAVRDQSTARSAAASVTLGTLQTALRTHDAASAAALGLGAGKSLLQAAAQNVARLGLVDLSLRFVDDVADDPSQAGAWQGTVEVRYRLQDWDRTATTDEVTFVFAPGGPGGSGERITAVGGDEGRTPLWLAGPVTPLARGRTLVLARSGSPERYSRLALHAVVAVDRVLPRWTGRLVIEVPGSQDELDRALGATGDQYSHIAAVTASVDGSLVRTAPVHVFLNPAVFDPLGPRGAQVVVSHESTHVATLATFSRVPTWLLEGFADYVALVHAHIGVQVAAAQILTQVRRHGPPQHLPTADDLAPTAPGLGATYEEAWLAARFLAARYGEAKLVAFYDAVDAGSSVARAFGEVLGTSQGAFEKAWSVDTRRLAAAR
jgi:hypothetical protein